MKVVKDYGGKLEDVGDKGATFIFNSPTMNDYKLAQALRNAKLKNYDVTEIG